ncbi:uncharacterized protein NPIL_75061 [Nephila pilipes]|uniref:Uncharacterized protein n=1 Tax=Nephila pilipes TaxID=299642 RepID=A0A8X6I5K9_NEPPI|nr:uncharacterized protein NPIL_75061 [Nephila pilipes]
MVTSLFHPNPAMSERCHEVHRFKLLSHCIKPLKRKVYAAISYFIAFQVRFGFTFKTGQYGYHRIGPLECTGNAIESTEKCTNSTRFMKCNTGHYVSNTYRCRYEFDPYGYHLGCRDVTHLRQCGKLGYVYCFGD